MSTEPARRGWRYRGNVAARIVAAGPGGYALAALAAFTIARLWPADRLQGSVVGSLVAWLVMPMVIVWVFLARSPVRAVASVLGISVALAAIAYAVGPHG